MTDFRQKINEIQINRIKSYGDCILKFHFKLILRQYKKGIREYIPEYSPIFHYMAEMEYRNIRYRL